MRFFASQFRNIIREGGFLKSAGKKNTIIYGTGKSAMNIKKLIEEKGSNPYHIVAFIDPYQDLQNKKKINRIAVYSPQEMTRGFLEKHKVNTLISAINDIPSKEKGKIYRHAVESGVEVMETPQLSSTMNGMFRLEHLRRIELKDILDRNPVKLNVRMIENGVRNKTVLVAGAAGFIGSEIVKQLIGFTIWKLILVDEDRASLECLENEFKDYSTYAPVRSCIADIHDEVQMDRVFSEFQPDIVFHAAAYQFVPPGEHSYQETIRMNLGKTVVLSDLSLKYGTKKFVLISTQKAVNPDDAWSSSMRMCELFLQSQSTAPGNRTQFVTTRLSNVMGSTQSDFDLFRKQIDEGGPVMVPHPNIMWHFLTDQEVSQLILEATFMGLGGEVFEFDTGKPVKILNLVRYMIALSGNIPEKEIQINIGSLGQDEQLHENLIFENRNHLPTYNPRVHVTEVAWLDHKKVRSLLHNVLKEALRLPEWEYIGRIEDIIADYKGAGTNVFQRDATENSVEVA